MANKKLLYAPFVDLLGLYRFDLSANSSDNIPIPSPQVTYDSREKPLNQVGMLSLAWDSNDSHLNDAHQIAVYNELAVSQHYGAPIGLLQSNAEKNVPLYLFGQQVKDGVAMPYVKFVQGSYTTVLHYFTSDGTDLGILMSYVPSDRYPSFLAGQLYDDGTFTGNVGGLLPYEILPGVYSKKRYKWFVLDRWVNRQFINPAVMADLYDYLPTSPEGEYTSPGDGDFDATSDPIGWPDLPTLSALDTGLTAMYIMSDTGLKHLSQFLWSPLFDLDTFKKMFNDPMQSILNLCISPVDLTTGSTDTGIRIGNINTGVSGKRIPSPYKIIDFGVINMNEYWASFADYSPYTKLSIFLPYVGVQQISIDDVMRGSIQLKAYCDVLTGSVQYILKSTQSNPRYHGHDSVLYTWGGNCQYQIPLSASNMTSVINSIISTTTSIAAGIGLAVATEGASAPLTAAQQASLITGATGSAAGVFGGISGAKTTVQRGGGLGGAVGLFGVQKPYLILERPEQVDSELYDGTVGVPNEKTDYLKNYSGFVQVRACNLSIPGATKEDLEEIEALLKEGVIV